MSEECHFYGYSDTDVEYGRWSRAVADGRRVYAIFGLFCYIPPSQSVKEGGTRGKDEGDVYNWQKKSTV